MKAHTEKYVFLYTLHLTFVGFTFMSYCTLYFMFVGFTLVLGIFLECLLYVILFFTTPIYLKSGCKCIRYIIITVSFISTQHN